MGAALNAATKRWLVQEAEGILENVKGNRNLEKQTAQLRNLVQITQEESEISVLRNFIRYQTGRKTTRDFWLLIHEGVIRVLEAIGEKTELQDGASRKAAIQQFFGYLVRHYVYIEGVRESQRKPGGTR
ncbi:MAG TPA: hypothetical protein VEW48_01320 [Thermoanaerobaculia bacterium]|nr:hypothetical protein [Thermoanaerobaculia bacterium]